MTGCVVENRPFKLVSRFQPTGDQPAAISRLVDGVRRGDRCQTLKGVTGSGKTFTMANVIQQVQRPTLVLAHNKTLAAQLCAEFRDFFPENAVEYFVSYYDYYQPESYLPLTDLYIEKDCDINEEIDRLRHSATTSLFERRDVIIVASVSCIYGLGDPEDYRDLMITLRPGMERPMDDLMQALIEMQYQRNDFTRVRGTFGVHGDTLEIFPAASSESVIRVEYFGDEIDRIREVNSITGEVIAGRSFVSITPASHHAIRRERLQSAVAAIMAEMEECAADFKAQGRFIEAQRIEERTANDMEMLTETGMCKGIENYSRHLSGREPGTAPYTLLDFMPDDFLMFIDESHVTIPQVGAMYNGDRARKENLVRYGWRLPSAFDNRPLMFDEFVEHIPQMICVSATPSRFEAANSTQTVEQLIRPTGLLDPRIIVRPVTGQVDDLLDEIGLVTADGDRVLVTTLTKKMAEDLTDYMDRMGIRVRYLHSEVATIERAQIIEDLRRGDFDVLVGINLLREGLDIPEVGLVAILDADKEGFLRSETSLIQTVGRAARNVRGRVIMYADTVTDSMSRAIAETDHRRQVQEQYNLQHGITPRSITKDLRTIIETTRIDEPDQDVKAAVPDEAQLQAEITRLTAEMRTAADQERYETAAVIRDRIYELRARLQEVKILREGKKL